MVHNLSALSRTPKMLRALMLPPPPPRPQPEQQWMHACRVVLVGDPQQLPATVLSRQAQLANMERSMFERYTTEPISQAVMYPVSPQAWYHFGPHNCDTTCAHACDITCQYSCGIVPVSTQSVVSPPTLYRCNITCLHHLWYHATTQLWNYLSKKL